MIFNLVVICYVLFPNIVLLSPMVSEIIGGLSYISLIQNK